jgi:CMP-N,N'-diacetyllegionaminic acid synthase
VKSPSKKRLCTINARGGSKGVPGKNWALIAGTPLLTYTIRQAIASGCFEMIAVSSDSERILEIAALEGAETIRRPRELAMDSSPKVPAIIHCVEKSEERAGHKFQTIVDLDVTSPLRKESDIISAVDLLERDSLQSVFSACHSRRSPYFNLVATDNQGNWGPVINTSPKPIRRQEAPSTFDMNASIYVWNREDLFTHREVFLERTGMYLMPEERSLDIDSALDFKIVEFLLEQRTRET